MILRQHLHTEKFGHCSYNLAKHKSAQECMSDCIWICMCLCSFKLEINLLSIICLVFLIKYIKCNFILNIMEAQFNFQNKRKLTPLKNYQQLAIIALGMQYDIPEGPGEPEVPVMEQTNQVVEVVDMELGQNILFHMKDQKAVDSFHHMEFQDLHAAVVWILTPMEETNIKMENFQMQSARQCFAQKTKSQRTGQNKYLIIISTIIGIICTKI